MADYMAYALGRGPRRGCSRCCSRPCATPRGSGRELDAGRRARRAGDRAEGRAHRGREGDGDRALRRARGRARRVRGAVRRVRRARGAARSRRWPTRWSCSRRRGASRGGSGIAAPARLRRRAGAVRRPGAHDLDVPFARGRATRRSRAIDDVLDPGLVAANPLDAWGTGIDADRIFRESLLAFARRPRGRGDRRSSSISRARVSRTTRATCRSRATSATRTTKPFCVLSNLASAVALEEAAYLRDRGIPVLGGHVVGARRVAGAARPSRRAGPPRSRRRPPPCADEVRDAVARAARDGRARSASSRALALLADYGVPRDAGARRVDRRRGRGRRGRGDRVPGRR